VAEQAQAENMLTSTLRSLFAVAEAYPDLKANTNFLQLQQELTNVEQKVGYARQFYNDSVTSFNMAIQVFPANLIAGMFGFTARDYFEIQAAEKEAPKVEF
jgi:LemA protein